jgi:hypothetical protein
MFRRWVVSAVFTGMLAGVAHADMITLSQSAYWSTIGGIASDGRPMCGVTTKFPNAQFMVKWQQGGESVFIQIFKEGWNVPLKAQVDVSIQFDRATPWTGKASGIKIASVTGLELTVPSASLERFLNELRFAASMTVSFPTGSEPNWAANMTGSNNASLAMFKCYRDYTAQARPQQTQPFATQPLPQPVPQPYAAPATQPAPPVHGGYRTI